MPNLFSDCRMNSWDTLSYAFCDGSEVVDYSSVFSFLSSRHVMVLGYP